MRFYLFALTASLSIAGSPVVGHTASSADAVVGVVADQCTSCHKVPGYEARWDRADLNARSFVEIAQDPEKYPPAQVRAFLQNPHWPMSQFVLSPTDIDAILAVIAGLK